MEDEGRLTVSSEFGNLLRRYRLAAGLSQEQLAERAKISPNGISALERGYRRNPQRETVALLAGALMLSDDQRKEIEAAARAGAPRRIGGNLSLIGRPRDSIASNLPQSLTSFVGRDNDVAEVKDLLGRYRLLTLAGAGGIGKTRLAVHVGAELLSVHPDGVWFVDLAPISDPELVTSVVAQALQLNQQQGHRLDETIPQLLKRKRLLLIFDNCEHILGPTATLASAILATAQDVRILATSRQPLDISGEAVYRLRSLAVPTTDNGLTAEDALRYGAIALFVDRANAADTHFLLTDKTAPIVAKICHRLDGIALAIELAAARVTVLSISALARQLDERFQILRSGNRNAPPRHKTLVALIDWSYQLLAPQEQLLFARLSVFSGGFDLDAVTAVCGAGSLAASHTFDLLSSLIDKSLVVVDRGGEQERYRLLESMVAYASEKLGSRERELLARDHAIYFRKLAEATAGKRGEWGSSIAWRARIEPELDNYRAALEWALTHGNDAALGGAIASALAHLWWAAGLSVEGRYWVELALPRLSEAENPAILARLYNVLCKFSAGKPALDAAERALHLFQSIGDVNGAARAQRFRGGALFQMGRVDEAHEAISQALETLRQCSDEFNVTNALRQLAFIEKTRGNFQRARELYAQALAAWKARGGRSLFCVR